MTQLHWWQTAVVYQIYPRSFADSNGDGIGDLPGIIAKLDYLQKLGIGAIWLSPVYKSPNDDNGYDISDYQDIMDEFGTMADMKKLIAEATARDIRLVMDLVVNHTSDEHAWFIEAKKARTNKFRDYYVWRDANPDGSLPNALTSIFSGPAWHYDKASNQYYLHMFSQKQPDLNWENPQVRREVHDMINFWLDKGIGGFRLDVIDMIGKIPDEEIISNGPNLHTYLHDMNRASFGQHDVLTVGETWGATPEIAKLYSNPARAELSMVFQFETEAVDQLPGQEKWDGKQLDVSQLKKIMAKWQTELGSEGWNSLFWSNHDLPRAISRFGSEEHRVHSGKMLAIVLHLLKGTPYIYQGEEIGMVNRRVTSIDEVADIESRNMYHERRQKGYRADELIAALNRRGRDIARSPMQWDAGANAGFTTGTPWLSITQDYQSVNVAAALADPDSLFYTYQKLIALRKNWPLVVWGEFALLDSAPEVFAYTRSYQGETLLVVANFSAEENKFSLPSAPQKMIASNIHKLILNSDQIYLAPYDAFAVLLS